MVKNEEDLLNNLLPIWKKYPIDKFVFYNDNSTDKTVEVIGSILEKERFVILNDKRQEFNESHNRSRMLEYSRDNKAQYVFSIDSDELLSTNLIDKFDKVLSAFEQNNVMLYWYNVVEDSLSRIRQDAQYKNNYRSFILPLKHTGKFDLSLWKYHTPRVPNVFLPNVATNSVGVIHLQAMNKRFYAIKQLWYKHYEYVKYGHSVAEINSRYDPVVNDLNFQSIDTPKEIIENINIDCKLYDSILKKKGYLDFINKNYNNDLVTFGKEYLK
jgi:hypothetical protein